MKKYNINDKTLALYSLNKKTRVYEEEGSFVVENDANSIMEESCAYFGSSLEGRKKGTKELIGVSYKPPVIVEESKDLIFFPTESSRSLSCSWIRHDKVQKYYYKNGKLVICFKNGDKLELSNSLPVIENQILRSSRLESVLNSRKNGD